MRIDDAGRVMIAETSNSGYSANADDLIIGDNGSATERGISIGSTAGGGIRFNDGADAGVIEYAHSDNSMRLYTAAAERMRIDSSGIVGIGNTVAATIHGVSTVSNLVVGTGSGNNGIGVYSGSSNLGAITFADGTSGNTTYRGGITYNHSTDHLELNGNGGTAHVIVHSSGVTSIPSGIELGSGLDATAANTLDDYEEGTFTPTFSSSNSTATGSYTKIGNQVTVHFRVISTGGLPSGGSQVQVGNLPFTIGTNFGGVGGLYVGPSNVSSATGGGGTIVPYVTGGESFIRFLNVDTGTFGYTLWGELEVSHNNVVTAIGTVTYQV